MTITDATLEARRRANGEFGEKAHGAPEATLTMPADIEPDMPSWVNHGRAHGATFSFSQENELLVTFSRFGGYIKLNPTELGVTPPDDVDTTDARLWVGTENHPGSNTVEVQYSQPATGVSVPAGLTDSQLKSLETHIYSALNSHYSSGSPVHVIDCVFDADDTVWCELLVNTRYFTPLAADGTATVDIDGVISELNELPVYTSVRAGEANEVINTAITEWNKS